MWRNRTSRNYGITYTKYCVISYLLGEQTNITEQARKEMDDFIKRNRQLIIDMLRLQKVDADFLVNIFRHNAEIMEDKATKVEEAIDRLQK